MNPIFDAAFLNRFFQGSLARGKGSVIALCLEKDGFSALSDAQSVGTEAKWDQDRTALSQ